MDSVFASCILLFYALLVLQGANGSRARGITEAQWGKDGEPKQTRDYIKIYDAEQDGVNDVQGMARPHRVIGHDYFQQKREKNDAQKDESSSSDHMHHIDPELNVFFTVDDLWVGKTMPIFFPIKGPSTAPHLLPREEAEAIPFASSSLSFILKYFSFPEDSEQAKAMEYTLRQCQLEPIKGETKFCATSLESMLDSIRNIFGPQTKLKTLTTTHLAESAALLQNYTILDTPKEITAPKMVACHSMPYPYAVFYCHCQESANKLFKISLGGDAGGRVDAAAVCHMDTSKWDLDHAAFRVLGVEPGSSPVCHFFPADNLIWVPAPV